jgi:hypothetical protein
MNHMFTMMKLRSNMTKPDRDNFPAGFQCGYINMVTDLKKRG